MGEQEGVFHDPERVGNANRIFQQWPFASPRRGLADSIIGSEFFIKHLKNAIAFPLTSLIAFEHGLRMQACGAFLIHAARRSSNGSPFGPRPRNPRPRP